MRSLLTLLILALIVLTAVAYTSGTVIAPGQMGVRLLKFGPGQGYTSVALEPGYHWSIPGYSQIYVLPRGIRILNLHREGTSTPGAFGPLEVQTTDGATVDVDISILHKLSTAPRVADAQGQGKVGGPADLISEVGLFPSAWDSRIRIIAVDELKQSLGRLSTVDFYDRSKQEEHPERQLDGQLLNAAQHIKDRLAPFGVIVESVLLRRYTYRAERIDQSIFAKNLQEVEERANAAAGGLAKAKAELEDVAAGLDAKIQTLKVQGDNRASVIRSQGDLLENQKRAEGDLALARARAEIDRLRATALARSAGAEIFVARELAPLLASIRGGVVNHLDPYDLDLWAKKFGVKEGTR